MPRILNALSPVSAAMLALVLLPGPGRALAREPGDVAGLWDVSRDQDGRHCRLTLKPEQSDKGDHFAIIPTACRHLMPVLMKVGRWDVSGTHLALRDPTGATVLDLAAAGEAFEGQGADGLLYKLTSVPAVGRSVIGDADLANAGEAAGAEPPKAVQLAATKRKAEPEHEHLSDLAGRYAILRDKGHDTGCMLTLDDKTRTKAGARAALAPACRDQGIVVFDPEAWQLVNGRLVLRAKAGHVTHLDKQEDGTWVKDPAEGKSLSLKKL